jgi:hypothetical protein
MKAAVPGLLCLLLFSVSLQASSVLALIDRTNNRHVIAAGCRVDRDPASTVGSKIIMEPGSVVAIAGLYSEKSSDFELRVLIRRAYNSSGNLQDKAERFVRTAQARYEAAIRRIREVSPQDFASTTVNQPIEVVLAGIQDGQVALVVEAFTAVSEARGRSSAAITWGRTTPGLGYSLGLNKQIRAYVGSHPSWAEVGYPKAARRFVQLEIHAHPDRASPPLAEVEIDSKWRVKWLSLGACGKPRRGYRYCWGSVISPICSSLEQ